MRDTATPYQPCFIYREMNLIRWKNVTSRPGHVSKPNPELLKGDHVAASWANTDQQWERNSEEQCLCSSAFQPRCLSLIYIHVCLCLNKRDCYCTESHMHCLCGWAHSPLFSAVCHLQLGKTKWRIGQYLACVPTHIWVRPQDDVNWWRPTKLRWVCWVLPVKDPTSLLISSSYLTWWIGLVPIFNKRYIYVNERAHALQC